EDLLQAGEEGLELLGRGGEALLAEAGEGLGVAVLVPPALGDLLHSLADAGFRLPAVAVEQLGDGRAHRLGSAGRERDLGRGWRHGAPFRAGGPSTGMPLESLRLLAPGGNTM